RAVGEEEWDLCGGRERGGGRDDVFGFIRCRESTVLLSGAGAQWHAGVGGEQSGGGADAGSDAGARWRDERAGGAVRGSADRALMREPHASTGGGNRHVH